MKIDLKPCPECGMSLVIRTNRTTDDEFIGCSQYPRCTYSQDLPESIRMQRMGAPTLFDDEENHE